MTGHDVGPVGSFKEPMRNVIDVNGTEVGIYYLDGRFHAYENICPHMGGPVCLGQIIPKVDEDIASDGSSCGMRFSGTQTNIVCPWHGYEFDIVTGAHPGDPKVRMRRIEVEEVDDRLVVYIGRTRHRV